MQVCNTAMTFKVKTQMKDRSPILHTPPCNTAACVKILLWSKIAYKRNSVYRVRVKRGLPVLVKYRKLSYFGMMQILFHFLSQGFRCIKLFLPDKYFHSLAANTLAAIRTSTRQYWGRDEPPTKPSRSTPAKERRPRCCQTPCRRLSGPATLQH
jgi:hypothetical protein